MAEVSFLKRHDEDDDDLIEALDSVHYRQSHHDFDDAFDLFDSDPFDFHPSSDPLSLSLAPPYPDPNPTTDVDSEPDSITAVDLFDRDNQVNFVMDLFHQRVEQSSMRADVLGLVSPDPVNEMDPTGLELDLGLGFDDDYDGNFGFRVGVRVVSDSEEDENEFLGMGLNAEDDDNGLDNNGCDDDTSLQLCWDSFQLEDHRDTVEDFEWEEVDGRVDEREVLSMFDMDEDLDVSVPTVIPTPEEEMGMEMGTTRNNLEWEVLLSVHNLETNLSIEHDSELYLGDHDTLEYEMLFGQFAENENAMIGRPPASKTVVENLELVILTQEDVKNDNSLCAVCKDGINVGEEAKQLPCSHRYHGDCIVPWLGIRNTCPVCRYELPTDDPDYERRRRTQRAGRGH